MMRSHFSPRPTWVFKSQVGDHVVLEVSIFDDALTKDQLAKEFQAFMIGSGYFFEEGESVQITKCSK
jgi:hypothetical protein